MIKINKSYISVSLDIACKYGCDVAMIYGLICECEQNGETLTNKFIAKTLHMSTRSATNNIKKLIDLDLIQCITVPGKENVYKNNIQPKIQPPKDPKVPYGAEQIVKMTEKEYSALVEEYGEEKIAEYIKRMESYYHSSGKTYSDYAYKIREWIEADKNRPAQPNYSAYSASRRKKDKPVYNFGGGSYRMMIEKLPAEERSKYYKECTGKYAHYLDLVAEKPLSEMLKDVQDEKMYMSFVNQFDFEDEEENN